MISNHPIAVVFLVALLLRLVFVGVQIELQLFDIAFDAADSSLYRSLGERLAAGRGFVDESGTPTAFVGIGYPAFLAVLFQVSESTSFIAFIQALVGAATVALIGWMGRVVGGTRGFWLAGLAAAFYPHLIFWTGYVLTETLYVFLIAAGMAAALAVLTSESHPKSLAALSAAGFAAAALVRPIALGLGLAIAVVAIGLRNYRKAGLVGLATMGLILAPWVVRNAVQLGSPVITSTESGYVLWQGNSPAATGGKHGYVDSTDFAPLDLPPNLSEAERDAEYREAALNWMVEHPARAISLVPKKLWNMWRPLYEGASAFNAAVTYLTYIPLLVAAVFGFYRIRRQHAGILLMMFVAYHLFAHGVVTGMIRFRLPVEALLLVAIAGLTAPNRHERTVDSAT